MKIKFSMQQAFNVLELLVVICLIGGFVGLLTRSMIKMHDHDARIGCVDNLKWVGVGFRLFANDHEGKYPMQISTNEGGSMELSLASTTFRHFQILSNYLISDRTSAKIVHCPADSERTGPTNFSEFSNQNVSYFVGLSAEEANGSNNIMILSGDRNLTQNGTVLSSAVYPVTTNVSWGWDSKIHKVAGNIGLSEGSVQQVKPVKLQELIQATPDFNRFSIP